MRHIILASIALFPALVAAIPLTSRSSGLTIPLFKTLTSLFIKENGYVDIPSVQDYIRRVQAKYVQLDGLNTRGTVELDNSNNTEWTGEITVGTPPCTFTAMFDTGSSDVVVPTGAGCQGCYQGVSYDPSASSSSKALGKSFALSYGSGAVSGMQYQDTISIAGVTATNQTLLAANHSAADFFSNMNALVGLGFSSQSNAHVTSIVQTLRDQKQLADPVFGFKLAENGSELAFGGTNKDLYKGEPTYVPVTSENRWQVKFDKMTLWNQGEAYTPNNTAAVIDSGTTLILADPDSVSWFYNGIYGSEQMDNGMWSVACYNVPQINITFGGKEIAIPTNVFTLGPVDEERPRCLGGVQPAEGLSFWVMGDILMRNVYTIFDVAERRVGFADLK